MIRLLEFNGKTQSIPDWAKELGVAKSTIFNRLYNGWSVERALTEEVDASLKHGDGKTCTKNDAELWMNDHPESIPTNLMKLVDLNARTKKLGTYLRTYAGKTFDKWYKEVFCKQQPS